MNKDKAIQLLERLQDPEPYEPMLTKDAYDAIQMAIDALSADGDTISRKATIDVIDSFNVFESRCDQIKLEQMIGELPPANTSEIPNSSDTISRAKAIEAINKALDRQTLLNCFVRKVAIDAIKQLPPIQPRREERKTGEWIYDWGDWDFETCKCSECGNHITTPIGKRYSFCPNCGADMRGEQK